MCRKTDKDVCDMTVADVCKVKSSKTCACNADLIVTDEYCNLKPATPAKVAGCSTVAEGSVHSVTDTDACLCGSSAPVLLVKDQFCYNSGLDDAAEVKKCSAAGQTEDDFVKGKCMCGSDVAKQGEYCAYENGTPMFGTICKFAAASNCVPISGAPAICKAAKQCVCGAKQLVETGYFCQDRGGSSLGVLAKCPTTGSVNGIAAVTTACGCDTDFMNKEGLCYSQGGENLGEIKDCTPDAAIEAEFCRCGVRPAFMGGQCTGGVIVTACKDIEGWGVYVSPTEAIIEASMQCTCNGQILEAGEYCKVNEADNTEVIAVKCAAGQLGTANCFCGVKPSILNFAQLDKVCDESGKPIACKFDAITIAGKCVDNCADINAVEEKKETTPEAPVATTEVAKCVCLDNAVAKEGKCHCALGSAFKAAECSQCKAGEYSDDGLTCKPCADGSMSAGGASQCTACGSGKGSSDHINCVSCQGNTAVVDGVCKECTGEHASVDHTECKADCGDDVQLAIGECALKCPANQGATAGVCGDCANFASSDNLACLELCPGGQVPNGKQCEACPGDKPNTDLAGTACVASCDGNQVVTDKRCTCPAGHTVANDICTPCTGNSAVVDGACTDCDKSHASADHARCVASCGDLGQLQASATDKWCVEACADGEIHLAGVCQACGEDFVSLDGEECVSGCPGGQVVKGKRCALCSQLRPLTSFDGTSCVAGCATGQAVSNGRCVCAAGHYYDKECKPCIAGSISLDGKSCIACPAGAIVAGGVQCMSCSPGSGPDENRTACIACAAGTFSADGKACVACAPGTIAETASQTACAACPAGKVSAEGKTCEPCEANEYAIDGILCMPCPEGSTSTGAEVECEAVCKPGQKYDGSAPSKCTDCLAGTFSDDGMTCKTCTTGTVSSAGAKACARCAAGNEIKDKACSPCDAGKYSADGITCSECPSGYVAPAKGSVACSACFFPGYGPSSARDACEPCGDGQVSTGVAACATVAEAMAASADHTRSAASCGELGELVKAEGSRQCVRSCRSSEVVALDGATCIARPSDPTTGNTVVVDGKIVCAPGFEPAAAKADPPCTPITCASHCASCSSGTWCLRCNNGYSLNGGRCESQKMAGGSVAGIVIAVLVAFALVGALLYFTMKLAGVFNSKPRRSEPAEVTEEPQMEAANEQHAAVEFGVE